MKKAVAARTGLTQSRGFAKVMAPSGPAADEKLVESLNGGHPQAGSGHEHTGLLDDYALVDHIVDATFDFNFAVRLRTARVS